MKLVYSNESVFLATNIQNLLQAEGIEAFIKNEYAQGAIGEVSAFDAWPEVWVTNKQDIDKAQQIIAQTQSKQNNADWVCSQCNESNGNAFEVCWQCQSNRHQG